MAKIMTAAQSGAARGKPDLDRFRLRSVVETYVEAGEVETVDEPVDLVDVASRLDGNPRAVWYR